MWSTSRFSVSSTDSVLPISIESSENDDDEFAIRGKYYNEKWHYIIERIKFKYYELLVYKYLYQIFLHRNGEDCVDEVLGSWGEGLDDGNEDNVFVNGYTAPLICIHRTSVMPKSLGGLLLLPYSVL